MRPRRGEKIILENDNATDQINPPAMQMVNHFLHVAHGDDALPADLRRQGNLAPVRNHAAVTLDVDNEGIEFGLVDQIECGIA